MVSPAEIEHLRNRAMDLRLDEMTPLETELRWREQRIAFFCRLWGALSMYAEEHASNTLVKGEAPSLEMTADLYKLQMHSIVLVAVIGSMVTSCNTNFVPGFLDAAVLAGRLDSRDMPFLSQIDPEADLFVPAYQERQMGLAMQRALRILGQVLESGQDICLTAARQPAETLVIQVGYTDPRMKGVENPGSTALDPIAAPHTPHNDVDFVVDVLEGLRRAGEDDKMKREAHEFIAYRVALKEIRLWRGNYYVLKLD